MKAIEKIFAALLPLVMFCTGLEAAVLDIDEPDCVPTSITVTSSGTLLSAVQADGSTLLLKSSDGGEKWEKASSLKGVTDFILWRGFGGAIRSFYTKDGGLFSCLCPDPEGNPAKWTEPVKIAEGYCSSTPVVLRNGVVVLPAYLSVEDCPGVLLSMDKGNTWTVNPSNLTFMEKLHKRRPDPIVMPYRNGRLGFFNRSTGYEWRWISRSKDFGRSWSTPSDRFLYSPDTPMSLTILPSGRWLMVKNGRLDQRLCYIPDGLFAYMSDDEGETWYGDLVVDSRVDAVNPCVCTPGDGYIYMMYAYAPVSGECRRVHFVRTSEAEINSSVPTRNLSPSVNTVAVNSKGAAKAFEKEVAPYKNTKGKSSGAPLKMVSFNIEYRNPGEDHPWPKRLEYVNEFFRANQFDVIGVQEPFRPEYDQMVEKLGDMYGSIFACTNLEKDHFSNSIFYRRDRIELLEHDIFWYTEHPGQTNGFGGGSSRLCIWGKFRDRTSGNIFFVFNSHYDWLSYETMFISSRILDAKVREIAAGYPAICTGDYNAKDNYQAMKFLAAGPFLKDSMKEAKKALNTEYSTMGYCRPIEKWSRSGYHIDHIFFTPGLSRVDSWEIVSQQHAGIWGASDHNPIFIQWQLLK